MSPLRRSTRATPVLLVLAVVTGCATDHPGTLVSGDTTTSPPAVTATPGSSPTAAVSDQDVHTPQPTETTQDGRARVLPSVTVAMWNDTAGAVEVSAFVPVIETTGACTLTLTLGTSTASAESVAYADASSTSCDLLSVPAAQLSPGTWEVTVTYSSPDSTGSSVATEVMVP